MTDDSSGAKPKRPKTKAGAKAAPRPPAKAVGAPPADADKPGAGGEKRGRGAPLRDLIQLGKAKAEQWATLEEASDIWKDAKGHHRSMYRFYTDVVKRIESQQPASDEWVAHKLIAKQANAMVNILAAWMRHGGYSAALVKAMDEADHCLSMAPYAVT